MIVLALKMLIGSRASFIGAIFGIFLATLLISQQSAIFLGLISRSYRMVSDIPEPNLWVMDPATETIDRVREMPESYLDIVRSVPGVEWAVPVARTDISMVAPSGVFQICEMYGIDDATLIGAPSDMVAGNVRDLRREGAVIIDVYSAEDVLANTLPNGKKIPLKVGDELEINEHRAVVVGICRITRGFLPEPIIFTAYNQFKYFNPFMEKHLSFVAAKSEPDIDVQTVCNRINANPKMNALTTKQFIWKIIEAFLKTGILINFGLSVGLGFIIGFSIAGQIFYIMTLQNITYYALIKAIGGSRRMILQMITVQALLVGFTGFVIGIGATLLWGGAIKNTTLAFLFPWQLLLFTGFIVLLISIFTAALSIRKVFKIDPKVLIGT